MLEACGERIHPASALLANESRHIAAESRGHELNVFQAWRRMDEILLANFMVFDDVVRAEEYDLWIGDEAWELDYYLHENPELKRAAYCFLTDFVGWLPLPEGGAEEARLTADYNAEMIEQVERFPRVRDRAIFVGRPADIVPDAFGDGLPPIRAAGSRSTSTSPATCSRPARGVRGAARLSGERVCLVTVGGSGVGGSLLRRVIDAYPAARARIPDLRMKVVCGPRIDPASVAAPDGVELVGYVHDLSRELAACDVAVTHGGLTTCMELAAAKRPFLYAPLRTPLRAAPARAPPARALRRRRRDRLRDRDAGDDRRRARRRAGRRREPRRRRARRRRARGAADRRSALASQNWLVRRRRGWPAVAKAGRRLGRTVRAWITARHSPGVGLPRPPWPEIHQSARWAEARAGRNFDCCHEDQAGDADVVPDCRGPGRPAWRSLRQRRQGGRWQASSERAIPRRSDGCTVRTGGWFSVSCTAC